MIAEHGYEGAASADQDQQAQAVGVFIRRHARLARSARVTAYDLQRRFSGCVTTDATPFQSSGNASEPFGRR